MNLRSPMRNALGLGSAKGGSGHWFGQRITAVALAILGPWFVISLVCLGGTGHAAVLAWLHSLPHATLVVLLVAVAAHHADLGLQVVLEDYVAAEGTRIAVLTAVKFALVAAALIGIL
ncbi:MAG TPA: succinate dehydrogenase, hydrophobic membrane anchor protein, partial [Steroidobacteraceae bacterium]|nr:succinate dehydrogenase, hydrophobic membrane anchor protein [Steroidobacteraceae bacterium]